MTALITKVAIFLSVIGIMSGLGSFAILVDVSNSVNALATTLGVVNRILPVTEFVGFFITTMGLFTTYVAVRLLWRLLDTTD